MSVQGWVLTGGRSTRMGRDKALLPFEGSTLVETVARVVCGAVGNVTLVGSPDRYQQLGIPVVPDECAGLGPLGGLWTILRHTRSDWNLMAACDLPRLSVHFLRPMLEAAQDEKADCLIPWTPGGLEPLCAVYHRKIAPQVEWAIHHKILKMRLFCEFLEVRRWPVSDGHVLDNWNTPEDIVRP